MIAREKCRRREEKEPSTVLETEGCDDIFSPKRDFKRELFQVEGAQLVSNCLEAVLM